MIDNTNTQQNQNIIVYEDGEIELKVSVNQETIWLTQKQNISLHTIDIFKSQELNKDSTVKKYLTVQKEGNRKVIMLPIKTSNKYHDRFLIIDNMKAYQIGASLKDLAKKVFAFSEIDVELLKDTIDD